MVRPDLSGSSWSEGGRLEELVEAGVRHFIFAPIVRQREAAEHFAVYAKEIVPNFHKAQPK